MTCPTCELLASDTSHLEAVQQWECEKAELVSQLRRIVDITGFFFAGSSTHPNADSLLHAIVRISEDILSKYEVPA